MERKDVDDPSLSVDGERGLRGKQPRRPSKHSRNPLVKGCMPRIQHPIEISTAPSRQDIDPDLERLGNLHERGEAHAAHPSTLDPRDHGL